MKKISMFFSVTLFTIIGIILLGFLSTVNAEEVEYISMESSLYEEKIFIDEGYVPVPGPRPLPTAAVQCIKEPYPIKIIPIFNENGELIEKNIEPEMDPIVWDKLGFNPTACTVYLEDDGQIYKKSDISPTYKTVLPSSATPSIKMNFSKIITKNIDGIKMISAKRTLKPLGFRINWDKKKKILRVTKDKKVFEFYSNSRLVKIDKKIIKKMSSFAKNKDGVFMIPYSFIEKEFKDLIIK